MIKSLGEKEMQVESFNAVVAVNEHVIGPCCSTSRGSTLEARHFEGRYIIQLYMNAKLRALQDRWPSAGDEGGWWGSAWPLIILFIMLVARLHSLLITFVSF